MGLACLRHGETPDHRPENGALADFQFQSSRSAASINSADCYGTSLSCVYRLLMILHSGGAVQSKSVPLPRKCPIHHLAEQCSCSRPLTSSWQIALENRCRDLRHCKKHSRKLQRNLIFSDALMEQFLPTRFRCRQSMLLLR